MKNLIECQREGRVQCEVLQKYYLYHYSHLQIVFLILKRSLMIAKTNFIFFHVGAGGLCWLSLPGTRTDGVSQFRSNIFQKQFQFLNLKTSNFLHKSKLLLTGTTSFLTCHVVGKFSILHSLPNKKLLNFLFLPAFCREAVLCLSGKELRQKPH